MSRISGDGGSRVSIPADLLQTIQNIREVTGKQHSDEDIFSVFKECFSDPHETTQKLLYLGCFTEKASAFVFVLVFLLPFCCIERVLLLGFCFGFCYLMPFVDFGLVLESVCYA
jgi:hypothetical protein